MSSNKVSIGMPVYNGAKYLRLALDALLAQTHGDFELLISDNASTDDTALICTEYAGRDDRIHYTRNPENIGGARNLQRVLDLANHDLFMWAAHDDLWHPEYMRLCADVLMHSSSAVLSGTTAVFLSNDGERFVPYLDEYLDTSGLGKTERIGRVLREMKRNCLFYGLHRRAVISRLRLPTYYGFDHVWLAQLASYGEFVQRPEQYFYSRLGGEGSSADGYNASPGTGSVLFRFFPNLGLAFHFLRAVETWPELASTERHIVRRMVLRRFTSAPYPQRMLLDMALLPCRLRRELRSRAVGTVKRPGDSAA